MPTQFKFENVFRAPSVEAVLAAYFNADHLATQDKVAELVDRVVVDQVDGPETLKTTWKVGSARPLPLFVRAFVSGGRLSYLETMTWRRADNAIDLTVVPQILNGRVGIEAVYQLSKAGEGQVLRRYSGAVTVNITLLSGKIERGILAAFEKEMPVMTKCTQDWLDRTCNASASS
jgi:Protein of unknown function (DUF2505)